eukprot:g27144.t1
MARVIPLQQVDQRYVSPGRPTPLLRHATPTASPWGARSVTPTQSPVVRRAATPVTTPGQLPVYGQLPAFPSYTAAVGVPAAPVAGLSTWSARPAPLELAVGIVVRIGAVQCMISEPLGMGSFGVVWAAKTSAAPQEVAVKEMICNSDTELGRAERGAETKRGPPGQGLAVSSCGAVSCGAMDAASSVTCALAALALRLKNGQLTTAGKALLGALPILLMQWRFLHLSRRFSGGVLARLSLAPKETPGHCRAAGLVLQSGDPEGGPVSWQAWHEDFEERFIGTKEALESGSFDYIVVGSGSAGCPLAARLAKAGASVLLVEAGGEAQRSMEVQMPKKMWRLWQSEVDWGFRSVPQEKLLPPGRRLDMERGKTLGGSSAINYNMWVRGAPEDYDRWAEEFQCQGWSYQEVLPHFKSVERVSAAIGDASGDAASSAAAFRGRGGAVKPRMEEVEDFLRACEETGDARNEDYNGPRLPGVGYTQFNTEGGREDCFNAFIEPILRWYPNLHVASETFCRKVLLEKTDGQVRATGVQVELRTGDILEARGGLERRRAADAADPDAQRHWRSQTPEGALGGLWKR